MACAGAGRGELRRGRGPGQRLGSGIGGQHYRRQPWRHHPHPAGPAGGAGLAGHEQPGRAPRRGFPRQRHGRGQAGTLRQIGLNPAPERPRTRAKRGPRGATIREFMSHNTYGHLFRVTSFGESHGPAIGCVVDGCPPGIELTEADIQPWMEKRRPGQSKFVTQRQEPDTVKILSGVFQDERLPHQVTTGTPIGLLIQNVDQRSKDYGDIRDKYRPGHADFTYEAKYGVRDYRGGGRQSARETATRVAAGAIARKILGQLYGKVSIRGALVQMGTQKIDRANWSWDAVNENPFFCPDAKAAAAWVSYLEGIGKNGSSVGAIIEVVAEGIPAGLGAPVYAKLDNELAS